MLQLKHIRIQNAEKLIGSIGTIAHEHAVVRVSGGRLLVTSGDDASVRFLPASDGQELAWIAVGKKPDPEIPSNDGRQEFVMNADSGTVSVIDLEAMKVMRTITVKPAMQYAAVTPDGMLFVNDEDANEMETIDVANGVVGPAVSMPECEASSSLAYDANGQGLIAACVNGKAAIVDAKQHRLTGLVDISLSPDAVMLEERRRLVFVPCGEDGVLDILSLAGSEMMWVGRVQTEKDARTGAIDPANGKLHLPTASFAATPGPNRRPVAPPGAFHVLVVRPENAG